MFKVTHIIILILIGLGLCAQPYKNQRNKIVTHLSDTIKLDSLSIIPRSEMVLGDGIKLIDSSYYKINYSEALLFLSDRIKNDYKQIHIRYRVFPISFSKVYFHKDQKKFLSPDSLMGLEIPRFIIEDQKQNPFGDRIETSGSISRGLSFGNSQDVVVNSGLNLQINGALSDGIKIEGAISDKAIPLQPLGNTQRLEEFDKIYIKAYTPSFELQAGDVEVKTIGNSLLRYSRNVQGVALSIHRGNLNISDSTSIKTTAAVAKGKYSRNSYIGMEGNQGPYRLTGSEGETYIVVIAGSERVYIDGKLLTRGESNQYVIDYNLSEITFTPMMPITGNSRINIEFEYTERSYARFILASEVEQRFKKYTVRFSAFSEGDSKNQPYNEALNQSQITLLQGIGDRIDLASIPQIDSVGFNADKILYEKKDTMVNGNQYKIFKHSVNPTSSFFQVNFTYIGDGKGNYIPDYGGTNGRVFRWVAPINGKLSGNYEPVRVLVTPKRKQLATISIEKELSNKGSVSSEVAFSRNDLNTFSSIDKKDDLGAAIRMGFKRDISRKDSLHFSWVDAKAMFTSSHFTFIDRYRSVEFERDWNIDGALNGGGEKEGAISLGYISPKTTVSVIMNGLELGDNFSGLRNSLLADFKTKSIKSELNFSSLMAQDSSRLSRFNRLRFSSEYSRGKIVSGLNLEGEDNQQKDRASRLFLPTSFRWYNLDFYLGNPDSLLNGIRASYKIRKDWKAIENLLQSYSFSQDFGLNFKLSKSQSSRFNLYAGYRLFNPIDTSLRKSNLKENTLLTRLDYNFTIAKGFITANLGYEIGSGLEPKYLYYYIEVPAGQGVFTWNDYNSNGIKELDEFEVATFKDEAKFIRINLTSNQFVSVNNNALSTQFDIRPSYLIRDTSFFKTSVSKLTNQFSFSTKQKNNFDEMFLSINPLGIDIYDSSIVSISQIYRNSFAYNRFSRLFGVEWINSSLVNKQLLANGYEIANISSNQFICWLGLSPLFSLRGNYLVERKVQESEYFQYRNYDIRRNKPNIKLRYSGIFGLSIETGYEFEYADNSIGSEYKRSHSVLIEINQTVRSKAWINISSSLSKIQYTGESDKPVEYELLKGFKPGLNAIWEIKLRRKISDYFEMDLGYSGRYIASGRFVHLGSMQIRAVF